MTDSGAGNSPGDLGKQRRIGQLHGAGSTLDCASRGADCAPDGATEGRLPDAARDVLVLANPKAGARSRRDAVECLTARLTAAGYTVQHYTDIAQLQAEAAARQRAGTLRAVVAAGGDGTAQLVVNRTAPGVPVALLPLGTENLLAKFLGVGPDPDGVCQIIRQGRIVRFDAGQANGQLFLLMVGCGFDAEVVRRLHARRTGHIRHLSYVKPILQTIRSYQYPELQLYCDGTEARTHVARWAFAFNLPCYARGLGIAPEADGRDGLLDVCTFRRGSCWHGLRYLMKVIRRRHRGDADYTTLRTPRLRVEAEAPVPFQLDGEFAGYLPVDVQVVPGRLTVLVPDSWRA